MIPAVVSAQPGGWSDDERDRIVPLAHSFGGSIKASVGASARRDALSELKRDSKPCRTYASTFAEGGDSAVDFIQIRLRFGGSV